MQKHLGMSIAMPAPNSAIVRQKNIYICTHRSTCGKKQKQLVILGEEFNGQFTPTIVVTLLEL